jgi:transglutaminase/protease-like cytokinesis protein 3
MKRYNPAIEFSTAAQVAKNLEGDCRHHTVLTTAMCRAVGLPARTAFGLVYVEKATGPVLGFHMWTEVLVEGQWRGIDATMGRGGIGAGHVKVSDHSWHNTQSFAPLLPVLSVVGRLAVKVQQVVDR